MGITKSDFFTEKQNELANIFKALGHPARLAIVEFLLRTKSCYCGDIVTELPLAQPTISQHLKELKNAEIIQGNIEGKSICYCLNPALFDQLENLISDFAEQLRFNNSSCC
jgi:ArsR family transcriptional regulator, arsenate/arsenite/antimonite-responsive transcriptional repressor